MSIIIGKGRLIDKSPQGSDEWLLARAGVVTASNMAKVMAGKTTKGRSDYMHRLAHERLTGKFISEGFKSAYMERGNEIEDQARASYQLRTGVQVTEVGLIYLDKSKRIGASLDSVVLGHPAATEIKCPAIHNHSEYLIKDAAKGQIPAAYRKQVDAQIWIAGLEWVDFVSFHPEAYTPIHIQRVHRDEDRIKEMQDATNDFINELDALIEMLRELEQREKAA